MINENNRLIFCHAGRAANGSFYYVLSTDPEPPAVGTPVSTNLQTGGPFATARKAEKAGDKAVRKILGPQIKITEGQGWPFMPAQKGAKLS